MRPGEAVQAAWERYAGPTPTSITELVAAVGGTKAAAGVLGVTQRSVQRYVKSEAGTGGETRKASATQKVILGDKAHQKAVDKARGQGAIKVKFAGDVDIYGKNYGDKYRGRRDSAYYIDEDDPDFWDALYTQEWDETADAAGGAYLDDSTFADLDELEFSDAE